MEATIQMYATRRVTALLLSGALTAVIGLAQNVVSAHSGTVHYFEGDVSLDGAKIVAEHGRFNEMKDQQVLRTGLGRAEVLLTPGVVLRVGENSAVRMLDNRLVSTRVELVSGLAMLEQGDPGSSIKDPAVTIVYGDYEIQPVRYGLFEVSASPAEVRVFKGEAKASSRTFSATAKEGNLIGLTTSLATAKFDTKEADDLFLWSRDRSAYLSAANLASARTLASSGYGNTLGFAGSGYGAFGPSRWDPTLWAGFAGGWYYNSFLGMYSFIPFGGSVYSPFGFGYYNPVSVMYVYSPTYFWAGAGGSRTSTTTGLPLQSIQPGGSTQKPTLPRLGVTASLRPTQSVAAPGTQPLATLRVASPRTVGTAATVTNQSLMSSGNASVFGASNARVAAPLSSPISNSSSAPLSAPVMSAAPAAAAAPRAAAPAVRR